MTDAIIIHIPGEVRGKGRPRFHRATGRTYTPKETQQFEATVRHLAALAMGGRAPIQGPVAVGVDTVLPLPTSWSRRKIADALAGRVPPRGDVDNYAKAALDGIQQIVFADDKQVVFLAASKRYGERPGMVIKVREVGAP